MTLSAGDKLGRYEILVPIGKGGMGEVRAVASLNHPNICQLYDVGPDYLVLEYVDGKPVAPTDQVRKLLDLAVQIADGMAAAHAAGFVHRDLKPANVLVNSDGRVKILDFGLAKRTSKPGAADGTQAMTITDPDMVAGTAAYMSPEQASGSADLDARSDQFSCGLMLYEMATGKKAFKRSTAVETMAAILRDDPEPLPATLPAPLRWIIQRCLAKEPKDRYESSRDLFLELRSLRDHVGDTSSTQGAAAVAPAKRRKRWGMAAVGFGAGAAVAAATLLLVSHHDTQRAAELRYTPFSFEQGGQVSPVWSPDGKAVAFAARQKNADPFQIYVRYLNSPVATQLTHMAEPAAPIDWTSAGRIIFETQRKPAGLWSVSPVGGEPEPVLQRDYVAASVASDGSAVALFRRGEDGVFGVWISAPAGAAPKRYEPAPFASRAIINVPIVKFAPNGKQILLSRNALAGEEAWLMPYPADARNPPHRIFQNMPAFGGSPAFSWMPDNRHAVVSASLGGGAPNQLYMADTVSGEFRVFSSGTTSQSTPAVSPDGSKLVFVEATHDFDIVSVDLATAAVTPLIATQRGELMPAWAAGQSALAYVSDRNGQPEIWLHQPGQTDRPLVTARDFPPETTQWFMAPVLSPDAGRVIYTRVERAGLPRLWISAVAGGSPVRLVKDNSDSEHAGSWSPDGNWFVYWSFQPGSVSLKKVKTIGQAQPETLKEKVQPRSLFLPVWSPRGDWILHADSGAKLIAPDGKTTRALASAPENASCTFSRDGGLLYCLGGDRGTGGTVLFSMNLDGGGERIIGKLGAEYNPVSSLNPGLRLSLSPDGRSVTYSIVKATSNLWLIDGLTAVTRR